MKKRSEKVIFFGSGPVAAKSLEGLVDYFDIEAIITKSSTQTEMGLVSPDTPLFTANNQSELDELFDKQTFVSKLGILVDYGVIVSEKIIESFELGIVNSHFSLLPEWRGADPITFSILSGQKTTGTSLMLLVRSMDEGPLLSQTPLDIPAKITTPELTDELIAISNESLRKIIPLYMDGAVDPAPQEQVTIASSKTPTYSRKLTKQDGVIDWTKPAKQIEREIRAFAGWPKSRTNLSGKDMVITKASVVDRSGNAGEAFSEDKKIYVYCGEGALQIELLKPAGKKEMSAEAFLAGYKI